MVKILVLRKRNLYIALAVLVAIILSIGVFVAMSGSDETFSETIKYVYKIISPEQTQTLLEKNPDVVVFDIRHEEDFACGHLPQATLISYKDLKKQLASLDQEGLYVIYGDDDKESAKAAEAMANKGFSRVYVLKGGIEEWPYNLE